ncbi:hypothetical protein ACQ4PT_028856 [Festuca glaucescens]
MDGSGDVVVVGRAEIDTRAPFKSVKEAIALFGERVLAGELLHGGRRINTEHRVTPAPRPPFNHQPAAAVIVNVAAAPPPPRHVQLPTTRELNDAKDELEKEREDKHKMAGCILSLQEELSNAMRELKKLKARDEEAQAKVIDLQVEDLKFMEINNQQKQHRNQSLPTSSVNVNMAAKHAAAAAEFQKKRYVTFADPPTAAYDRAPSPPRPLPDVVMELHHQPQYVPSGRPQYREVRFQRQVSAGHETVKKVMAAAAEEDGRKNKKKPLIPLVGALFMRKKKSSSGGHHDDGSSAVKPRPSF